MIWQNWRRDKITTLINVTGLFASLLVVLTLTLYIITELNVDRFNQNIDRIFGVFSYQEGSPDEFFTYSPQMVAGLLKDQIPGIVETVRIKDTWQPASLYYNHPFKTKLLYADSTFFKIFTYECLQGNLETALNAPMSLVLMKEEADRLFGKENPIGQVVRLDDRYDLTVTAVIRKPAWQSALNFKSLVSMSSLMTIDNYSMTAGWGTNNFKTFALLEKGVDPEQVAGTAKKLFPDMDWYRTEHFLFYPYKAIYFDLAEDWIFFNHGSKTQVRIFILIAVVILTVAVINFINLSIARATRRSKETGIIKIIGGTRRHIVFRFVLESLMLCMTALFIALLFAQWAIRDFSNWLDLPINFTLLNNPLFLLSAGTFTLCLGLIAGIWPGLFFAAVSPQTALKNTAKSRTVSSKYLFAFQQIVVIALIFCTLIVGKQIRYGSENWGLKTRNIIGIKISDQLAAKKAPLKNELLKINGVTKVAFTGFHPGSYNSHIQTNLTAPGFEKWVDFQLFFTEPELFDLLGITLVQGRLFSENQTDVGKAVINETAAREFGLENPLQAKIMGRGEQETEVIGVVKDFHFQAKNVPIAPLVMEYRDYASWCYVQSTSTSFAQIQEQRKAIESIVKSLAPAFPAEIGFLDESIESLYRSEVLFQRHFLFFTLAAIFLACLGLLGLSIFSAQARTKEIGVRKVLGASVPGIVTLMAKEFTKWALFANIIAWPMAWYAMHQWLANYAYRINITVWPFLLASTLALLVVVATVCWQALRAATADPVKALKYE